MTKKETTYGLRKEEVQDVEGSQGEVASARLAGAAPQALKRAKTPQFKVIHEKDANGNWIDRTVRVP